MIYRVDITTRQRVELQDITAKVREAVSKSHVKNGTCHVFVPHTTAGVIVNEHADPAVAEDIAAHLATMVPQDSSYRHTEGNAPAHIKASMMGSSETLFIEDGELVLGSWQGVFFCEFDGPRTRHLFIKMVPDN